MALKFFRTCAGLKDEFYDKELMQNDIFAPVLDIIYETLPRDNLLNSACLELFEYVRRDNRTVLASHIVQTHHARLQNLTYVETFGCLIAMHDHGQSYAADMGATLFHEYGEEAGPTPPSDAAAAAAAAARLRANGNGQRWQGVADMDPEEEQYFNTSDDEDELAAPAPPKVLPSMNGYAPAGKALVDYPDDPDEEDAEVNSMFDRPPDAAAAPTAQPEHPGSPTAGSPSSPTTGGSPSATTPPAPERVPEKRRRDDDDDDEDELGKLALTKRRSASVSSAGSAASHASAGSNSSTLLRRKKNFTMSKDGPGAKKIAISLSARNPIEADSSRDGGS